MTYSANNRPIVNDGIFTNADTSLDDTISANPHILANVNFQSD
jgi:hypothetical protein